MSEATEREVGGFYAAIFKNVYEWEQNKSKSIYCSSEAVFKALSTQIDPSSVYLSLKLFLSEDLHTIECISEAKRLFGNNEILKMSERINLGVTHFPNFDKESVVDFSTLANHLIRRGVKLGKLTYTYYDCSFIEEEINALVQNLNIEAMKGVLPPLVLSCVANRVEPPLTQMLCHFLVIGWPVKLFSLKLKNFYRMNCAQLKRVNDNSAQHFEVTLVAKEKQTRFVHVLQAFYGFESISLDGFKSKADYAVAFFESNPNKWTTRTRNRKKLLISPLFGTSIEIRDNSICCIKLEEDKEELFEELSVRFIKGRMMSLEDLHIKIDESMKDQLANLLLCMTNNNSLISLKLFLVDGLVEKKIALPKKLEKQIYTQRLNIEGDEVDRWIKQGHTIQYGRMKLMVVGNGQVGKSSTIRSILGEAFDNNIKSTLVADGENDISMSATDVSFKSWEKKNFESQWLTEEFPEQVFRIRNGAQDIIEAPSQKQKAGTQIVVSPRLNPIKRNKNKTGMFKLFKRKLLSTKKSKQKILSEKMKLSIDENDIFSSDQISKDVLNLLNFDKKANEAYTKENARLTIWDFGGQEVFYSLHHLFLSPGGLYLVVCNLKAMKDNLDLELGVLEFWLQSIGLHAEGAGVILVGTRYDEVSDLDCKNIDLAIVHLGRTIAVNIVPADKFTFFPLDNSNAASIENQTKPLKELILKCFNGDTNLVNNVWKKQIPIAWMYFMNYLIRNFQDIISSNKALELASRLNLQPKEVVAIVQFYENAGALLPFLKKAKEGEVMLSDYIVLHPDWLLKAFGCFIYEPKLHLNQIKMRKTAENMKYLTEYEKYGVLSKTLVMQILESGGYSSTNAHFLLKLSRSLLLMSDFDFKPDWSSNEDELYIVPAMIRNTANESLMKESSSDVCHNLWISFNRFIPIGLYERIFCLMISATNDLDGFPMKPSAFKNHSKFFFREFPVFLINQREERRMRISLPMKEFGNDQNSILNIIDVVQKILSALKEDTFANVFNPKLILEKKILEEENPQLLQCSWNDLYFGASKAMNVVRCVETDGNEDPRTVDLFSPFDSVAILAVKRKIEEETLIAEEAEKNKERVWDFNVFLAHTWGPNNETHDKVVRVANLLKERNFKVWLDETNLKYYVSNDIVRGLRSSACILIFITELYFEKVEDADTNASREFLQAVSKGTKYLVPVVLDPECLNPKSWAGSTVAYHLTDKLYFDFSSEEKIKDNFGKLCERISEMSEEERPWNPFDES